MIEKDVFLTSLSLYKHQYSFTSIKSDDDDYDFSFNFDSEEPGMKYIFTNHNIKKVVIVGTNETIFPGDERRISDFRSYAINNFKNGLLLNENRWEKQGTNGSVPISSYEFFLRRIYAFISDDDHYREDIKNDAEKKYYEQNRYETHFHNRADASTYNFEVVFVEDIKDEKANYKGLLDELRGSEEITHNIYLDSQGGRRTPTFVRNTVLQLLSKTPDVYHARLRQVIATDWDPRIKLLDDRSTSPEDFPNRVVDVTQEYKISDLFSGMSSFLNYGKVKDLKEQYPDYNKNPNIKRLVDLMDRFDMALTVNNIDRLDEVIKELIEEFENKERIGDDLFSIIAEAIRTEYKPLFEDRNGSKLPEILDWCVSKGMYYTALVFIEAKAADLVGEKGLIYPKKSTGSNRYERLFEGYLKHYKMIRKFPRSKFYNAKHFFLREYLLFIENIGEDVSYYDDLKETQDSNRGIAFSINKNPNSKDLINGFYQHYTSLVEKRNDVSHPEDREEPENGKELTEFIDSIKIEVKEFSELLKKVRKEISCEKKDNAFLTSEYREFTNEGKSVEEIRKKNVFKDILSTKDVDGIVRYELGEYDYFEKIQDVEFNFKRYLKVTGKKKNNVTSGSLLLMPLVSEYDYFKNNVANLPFQTEENVMDFADHCPKLTDLVIEGYVDNEGEKLIKYGGSAIEENAEALKKKIYSQASDIGKAINCLKELEDDIPRIREVLPSLEELNIKQSASERNNAIDAYRSIIQVLKNGKDTFDDVIRSFLRDDESTKELYKILYGRKAAEDLYVRKSKDNSKQKNKNNPIPKER